MNSSRPRLTHIGRPLDPSWPSNLTVLLLMPLGASIGAGVAVLSGQTAPSTVALEAGVGAGAVLGTWALGREIAPDDQRAAFVAMAFGFGASVVVPESSLLLVFMVLALARVVNRTVGPPARVTDSLAVLALVGWTAVSLDGPNLWPLAALAFALDAWLPGGRRRQWGFALAALGLMIAQLVTLRDGLEVAGGGPLLIRVPRWTTIAWTLPIAGAFGWLTLVTRSVDAVTDLTREPLAAHRVRAAMVLALLAAAGSLFRGDTGVALAAQLWAVLAGVASSGLLRLSGSSPKRGH